MNFLEDYEEAEKYFKTILKLDPDNTAFYHHLIGVYEKQNKSKCACEVAMSLGDFSYGLYDYKNAKSAYIIASNFDKKK